MNLQILIILILLPIVVQQCFGDYCNKRLTTGFPILQEWVKNVTAGKLSKSDKLGQVDHSTINYPPFRRSFYIEAQEIRNMTEKQVADYRMQLEDIKVRGKNVPRPVKNWNQCGVSGRIMDVLKKSDFTAPMPIQVLLYSLTNDRELKRPAYTRLSIVN